MFMIFFLILFKLILMIKNGHFSSITKKIKALISILIYLSNIVPKTSQLLFIEVNFSLKILSSNIVDKYIGFFFYELIEIYYKLLIMLA